MKWLVCPTCRETVGAWEYMAKGHVAGDCPMTASQRAQLGASEEE